MYMLQSEKFSANVRKYFSKAFLEKERVHNSSEKFSLMRNETLEVHRHQIGNNKKIGVEMRLI